ncbi:hypothetical protein [Nocardia sp. NPDC004750]
MHATRTTQHNITERRAAAVLAARRLVSPEATRADGGRQISGLADPAHEVVG